MFMCRHNAIQLEEKEKREKELLKQIIEEANQYKEEFHKKIEVTCQNNKAANREKEKVSSFLNLCCCHVVCGEWSMESPMAC